MNSRGGNGSPAAACRRTEHWIGGTPVAPRSGRFFDDLNPLDDRLLATAAEGTAADMDLAVRTAHQAFATFGRSLAKDREKMLCKAAELLERDRAEFIDILIDEIGSPITKAQFEVEKSIGFLRAAAGMARQVSGKTLPGDHPGRFSMSVRMPLGVVAAITPFNVPLIKGVRLSGNPMAIGNTVVLLPSEQAPLLAHRLASLYAEAGVPAGVFNVVTGIGHDVGDSLTMHPLVKAITFTGSCRVGAHIRELAGRNGKRLTLELGGKSPLVVLDDADLELAVRGAIQSIFMYQGQVCMGASRIYVQRGIHDEFLRRFCAAAQALRMGDLRDPATVIGPIINERQRARVRLHIEDARGKGAQVVVGGGWTGHRCQPTVLTGVTRDMLVHAEETFGPVAAVYPVVDGEEALARANDSRFGLSAAIYTANLDTALNFAFGVESGMVHVNAPSLHDEPHVPFGGTKDSGQGREGTEADIEAFTEWKWITVQVGRP